MLVLSFLLFIPNVIATSIFSIKTSQKHPIPSLPLSHLSDTLSSSCTNYVFIYIWFYNLLLHTNLYSTLH